MAAIPHPLLLPQHLNVLLLYLIEVNLLPVPHFLLPVEENTGSEQNLPFVYHNSVRLPQFQKVYHDSTIDPENIIFQIPKISQKKIRSFSKIRLFSKLGNLTQLNFLVKLTGFSK